MKCKCDCCCKKCKPSCMLSPDVHFTSCLVNTWQRIAIAEPRRRLLVIQCLGSSALAYLRAVESNPLPDEGGGGLGTTQVGLEIRGGGQLTIERQIWGRATEWDWYARSTLGTGTFFTWGVNCG